MFFSQQLPVSVAFTVSTIIDTLTNDWLEWSTYSPVRARRETEGRCWLFLFQLHLWWCASKCWATSFVIRKRLYPILIQPVRPIRLEPAMLLLGWSSLNYWSRRSSSLPAVRNARARWTKPPKKKPLPTDGSISVDRLDKRHSSSSINTEPVIRSFSHLVSFSSHVISTNDILTWSANLLSIPNTCI